jgi:hypothetical protein
MMKTMALASTDLAQAPMLLPAISPAPQAAAQGRKPSQNGANFRRCDRSPNDPPVVANRRFHGIKLKS